MRWEVLLILGQLHSPEVSSYIFTVQISYGMLLPLPISQLQIAQNL
jgi:hypothetical protein